jgi:hypothetical protein
MMRYSFLVGLLLSTPLLESCAPAATTWYRSDTTITTRDSDLVSCEYEAKLVVPRPSVTKDYSGQCDSDPRNPWGSAICESGQGFADAIRYQGEVDELTDMCMTSKGYETVEADSELEQSMGQVTTVPTLVQASQAEPTILLFGGDNSDVFLGCLSCDDTVVDSIYNAYGSYGSPYESESIFNDYGQYGSKYSDYSVCNPYAQNAPVIVDEQGGFYGRLTSNRYHPQANSEDVILQLVAFVCDQ